MSGFIILHNISRTKFCKIIWSIFNYRFRFNILI